VTTGARLNPNFRQSICNLSHQQRYVWMVGFDLFYSLSQAVTEGVVVMSLVVFFVFQQGLNVSTQLLKEHSIRFIGGPEALQFFV